MNLSDLCNIDENQLTEEQLFELMRRTRNLVKKRSRGSGFSGNLFALHYRYDDRLKSLYERLVSLKNSSDAKDQTAAGNVLESIAYVSFCCIRDNQISLQSYQSSVGPQIDLLVKGESEDWLDMAECLFIKNSGPSILVECKAWKSKIEDNDFSRLCAILDHNFQTTAGLGVFFTLKGATGIPTSGSPSAKHGKVSPLRNVSNCYLRQLLFYASKKKFVVVFDDNDLRALCVDGENLLLIIRRKIEEIEANTGLPVGVSAPHLTALESLPEHLKSVSQTRI